MTEAKGHKSSVSRKRKSSVEEDLMKMCESDNPFKMAADMEVDNLANAKNISDMKAAHRRVRKLYSSSVSMINRQRKERFGKFRLRFRDARQNNNSDEQIAMLMNNRIVPGYRTPCVPSEVDQLTRSMSRLSISPHSEQAAPLAAAFELPHELQVVANRLRNASLRDVEGREGRQEQDDNDERPPLKRLRRSVD